MISGHHRTLSKRATRRIDWDRLFWAFFWILGIWVIDLHRASWSLSYHTAHHRSRYSCASRAHGQMASPLHDVDYEHGCICMIPLGNSPLDLGLCEHFCFLYAIARFVTACVWEMEGRPGAGIRPSATTTSSFYYNYRDTLSFNTSQCALIHYFHLLQCNSCKMRNCLRNWFFAFRLLVLYHAARAHSSGAGPGLVLSDRPLTRIPIFKFPSKEFLGEGKCGMKPFRNLDTSCRKSCLLS